MKNTIRVAFWHNTFAPYRVPVFQRLAACEELDLTVYYGHFKDRHRAWTVDFGSGYQYVLLPSLTIPYYPHKLNYTLFRELIRQKYDVLIGVENEIGGQIAYLAARWTGKPFILWSVEINYHIIRDRQEYTPRRCLQKLLPYIGRTCHHLVFFPFRYGAAHIKRHADACLAAGLHTENHLLSIGAKCPIFRFGNTIDLTHFARQVKQQNISQLKHSFGLNGKTIILSVSYLHKRKGVQYLLEAYLQLHRNDTALLIVGDGEYMQELLTLVPPERHDILFTGHDEKTAKYYAIADIFAMPSFSDPWGLTVNEAMVAGLPVITTTNAGAQELIQGNGFVIPPRDAQALADALRTLLTHEALRKEMGHKSKDIISAYTIEHTAEVCRQAIHAVAGS